MHFYPLLLRLITKGLLVFPLLPLLTAFASLGCESRIDPTPSALAAGPTKKPEREHSSSAVAVSVAVTEAVQDQRGQTLQTTGRVAYDDDHVARLAAPVSGRILKLLARPGDEVKPGQVLATIHSQDVAMATAELTRDRARRELAEQSLGRAVQLLQRGAGTEREIDEARAQVSESAAAENRDRAKLRVLGGGGQQAQIQKGAQTFGSVYELRSPISGTVTERSAALGGGIQTDEGAPIFVVADLSKLWILVDVFEQDIGVVQPKAAVEVTVPAYPDRTFHGTVEHIGDTLDPATRAVKVRIQMDNADRVLKPGMLAQIAVKSVTPTVIVPASAILTRGEKTFVYVEDGLNQYSPRPVTLGSRCDSSAHVLKGLEPGERVVSRGGPLLGADFQQRL